MVITISKVSEFQRTAWSLVRAPVMYDQISTQIEQVTAYLHLAEVTIDTPVFKLHYVARSVGSKF